MAIWVKPDGREIEINDNKETVEYVKSLGWKPKVPRGRPPLNRGKEDGDRK